MKSELGFEVPIVDVPDVDHWRRVEARRMADLNEKVDYVLRRWGTVYFVHKTALEVKDWMETEPKTPEAYKCQAHAVKMEIRQLNLGAGYKPGPEAMDELSALENIAKALYDCADAIEFLTRAQRHEMNNQKRNHES